MTADLITRNAARIPRRRGMAASEARAAAAEAGQEPWTDPLQALLIAERAALLSGRDEEFVHVITMHYTGMRWGEVTGLEASNVKPGSIRIWWQLAEVNGVFIKIPPKYGSRRTIDIAPFLWDLISAHLRTTEGRECSCGRSGGTPLCEGSRHVFLGGKASQTALTGRPQGSAPAPVRLCGMDLQARSDRLVPPAQPAARTARTSHSRTVARPPGARQERPPPGTSVLATDPAWRHTACTPARPRTTCMDSHGVQKVLRDLVMDTAQQGWKASTPTSRPSHGRR